MNKRTIEPTLHFKNEAEYIDFQNAIKECQQEDGIYQSNRAMIHMVINYRELSKKVRNLSESNQDFEFAYKEVVRFLNKVEEKKRGIRA